MNIRKRPENNAHNIGFEQPTHDNDLDIIKSKNDIDEQYPGLVDIDDDDAFVDDDRDYRYYQIGFTPFTALSESFVPLIILIIILTILITLLIFIGNLLVGLLT